MIYSHVYKGGRCFNGFHKDGGTIVHLIEGTDVGGFWGGKALCGTAPGYRGYGWAGTEKEVTCPKCIEKFNLSKAVVHTTEPYKVARIIPEEETQEVTKLVEYLKHSIESLHEQNIGMDESSFQYEEGILITGNDAELILKLITRNT